MVNGHDFQLFRLSMSLTEEGERHADEIVELCYRFLALLKADAPQKRIQVPLSCCIVLYVFFACCCSRGL